MRLRFIHPQAEAWDYTYKAHLRGLIRRIFIKKWYKVYVMNQKAHHSGGKAIKALERCDEP
jgi:hypothetical protein